MWCWSVVSTWATGKFDLSGSVRIEPIYALPCANATVPMIVAGRDGGELGDPAIVISIFVVLWEMICGAVLSSEAQ